MNSAAMYDARNPAALKRLVATGTQLRAFPRPVMEACWKATEDTIAELNDKHPEFKKIYESWRRFRDDQRLWWRVAELSLDNFQPPK
jgi:TRAP-type mannitol/chloroaromatic compound transport system substrate-binding protein